VWSRWWVAQLHYEFTCKDMPRYAKICQVQCAAVPVFQ
jgi:hypothetical protein